MESRRKKKLICDNIEWKHEKKNRILICFKMTKIKKSYSISYFWSVDIPGKMTKRMMMDVPASNIYDFLNFCRDICCRFFHFFFLFKTRLFSIKIMKLQLKSKLMRLYSENLKNIMRENISNSGSSEYLTQHHIIAKWR